MNSQNNKWTAVDANAFLHCRNLLQLGLETALCTTSSVLNELKDQKTKDLINSLPFELKVELPSQKAMKIVRDFATKTGDIVTLSDPDLEIIAIAYDECLRRDISNKLNTEPKKLSEPQQQQAEDDGDDENNSSDQGSMNSQDEEQTEVEHKEEPLKNIPLADQKEEAKAEEKSSVEPSKEDVPKQEDDGWIVVTDKRQKPRKYSSEDEDQWITPDNYAEKKLTKNLRKVEQDKPEEELPVFVMTSDFSMQNVVLQMGIGLRSVEGVEIRSVKRFILECYACWAQYTDFKTNKVQVCSKCGYNTLSKVAFSIDSHGNRVLHRKRNWKPNQKIREWKDRKLVEQQRHKKNQRERKTKKASIFA